MNDRLLRQSSILLTVFFLFLVLPASNAYSQSSNKSVLKDVSGKELHRIVASYEGDKVVLINVWATWCAPCVEEFPEIVKLQREYEDQVQVIFISADFPDSRGRALDFLKKQQVNWTTYFKTGKDQEFIEAISESWTGALPFTKIINKEGHVVASWENSADYSKFEKHVRSALNL